MGVAVAEQRRKFSVSGNTAAWAALSGLVVAHVILATLLFDPKPFVGGDNAGYLILAESLETGQGYRDIYLPDAPLHAKYPPFYPVLIVITGFFGGGLIAFKLLSAFFTSASVVLLFLLARTRFDWKVALAVAAPFALNPVLLYYSHWVLSEAPFVALTLLALWASERMTESSRWLAVAVVAACLAYLTRAAGLPLLVALIVAIGWRRTWRQFGVASGAAAIVLGLWFVWGKIAASGSDQAYASEFLMVDPYDPGMGYVGPGGLLARVVNNIRIYSVEVLPQSLAGVTPGGGVNLLALLAGLLIIALALIAWVRGVRRVRTLELFTAMYLGLILLWPETWTDRRFLLPLLPVLLVLAAAGVMWCFDFMRMKHPVWVLPVVGALLALLAMPGHVRSVSYSQRCMRVYRHGDSVACYPPPWRAFVEAASWVSDNTAENVIVVNRKPRLFYLFSGRRGDVYPFTNDDDEMLAFLDDVGADYVLVAGLSATTFRYLVPVIRSVPERFAVEHTVGDPASPDAWVLAYLRSAER